VIVHPSRAPASLPFATRCGTVGRRESLEENQSGQFTTFGHPQFPESITNCGYQIIPGTQAFPGIWFCDGQRLGSLNRNPQSK
jgi:hypothetical protein